LNPVFIIWKKFDDGTDFFGACQLLSVVLF
jgi:hypothetical protein